MIEKVQEVKEKKTTTKRWEEKVSARGSRTRNIFFSPVNLLRVVLYRRASRSLCVCARGGKKREKKKNPPGWRTPAPLALAAQESRAIEGGDIVHALWLRLRARSGRSMQAHWRGSRPPFASLCLCSRDSPRRRLRRRRQRATVGVSPGSVSVYHRERPRGSQPMSKGEALEKPPTFPTLRVEARAALLCPRCVRKKGLCVTQLNVSAWILFLGGDPVTRSTLWSLRGKHAGDGPFEALCCPVNTFYTRLQHQCCWCDCVISKLTRGGQDDKKTGCFCQPVLCLRSRD